MFSSYKTLDFIQHILYTDHFQHLYLTASSIIVLTTNRSWLQYNSLKLLCTVMLLLSVCLPTRFLQRMSA